MTERFPVRADGQVDVVLDDPDLSMFADALNDCVSSLPPRGAEGMGPSTYWVDVTLSGLREAQDTDDDSPFAGGNISQLRLMDGMVEARRDYWDEDETGASMEVGDFRALLGEWRRHIVASASQDRSRLPDTYRRNPASRHPVHLEPTSED